MYEKVKIGLAVIILLFFTGASEAALAENSLKISLIKYDPYPVSPDSDFNIWVQIRNVGDNDVSAVSVEFVPKSPFTIKQGESSVKYPGTIRKNDELVYKYTLHVDKNAFVGTNSIEIGYRVDGTFTKKEFDIEVGNEVINTKGMVRLEKCTFHPETLMPGDTAIVTLILKNSASEYTIEMDGSDYSMNAQIQSAELSGEEYVTVTSDPYYNVGIIGPGDSVELAYNVNVDSTAPDGTYFLDFNLKGSARLYSLNLKIPITVDSSNIDAVLSEVPQLNPGEIILSVANNRPNTVNAASVIPVGNASFEPAEYFIGTMDPDELFTVKFDMKENTEQNDILFKLRFKNGNNWHESDALTVTFNETKISQVRMETESSLNLTVIALLAIMFMFIAGFFVFMKHKRAKSDNA